MWARLPPSPLEVGGYIHAGRTPARSTVSTSLLIAALAVALVGSSSAGNAAPVEAPVVVGAGPHGDPNDRPGGGFFRVTFSPDGDGRGDRVSIRVATTPGDRLVLEVHPESNLVGFRTMAQHVRSALTTLAWDGLDADGLARAAGSYLIRVCSESSGRCSDQPTI